MHWYRKGHNNNQLKQQPALTPCYEQHVSCTHILLNDVKTKKKKKNRDRSGVKSCGLWVFSVLLWDINISGSIHFSLSPPPPPSTDKFPVYWTWFSHLWFRVTDMKWTHLSDRTHFVLQVRVSVWEVSAVRGSLKIQLFGNKSLGISVLIMPN